MCLFEGAQCAHIRVNLIQRQLIKIIGEECLGRFYFQGVSQTYKKK